MATKTPTTIGSNITSSPAPQPQSSPSGKTPATVNANIEPVRYDWTTNLEGPQRDAVAALIALFSSYGLGSLAPKIVEFVQQGYGSETITILLQETDEYRERFAANEARRKAGLPVLSPAEYLATERAYGQALQAAGMPPGFYDDPVNDFRRFLEQDISPTEIAERAGQARMLADTVDRFERDFLERQYGLGTGDLAAYFLDPDRALPALQKQIDLARLGAARERAGYSYSQQAAERLYGAGIDAAAARQGYGIISQLQPGLSRLADISGVDYGLEDLEAEVFEQSGQAATRRRRLQSEERGRFGGSAATGSQTLARDTASSY